MNNKDCNVHILDKWSPATVTHSHIHSSPPPHLQKKDDTTYNCKEGTWYIHIDLTKMVTFPDLAGWRMREKEGGGEREKKEDKEEEYYEGEAREWEREREID